MQHRLPRHGAELQHKIKPFFSTDDFKAMKVDWMDMLILCDPNDHALFVSSLVAMIRIIRRLLKSLPAEEFRRTIFRTINQGDRVSMQFLKDSEHTCTLMKEVMHRRRACYGQPV
jgi:hypothetical protein